MASNNVGLPSGSPPPVRAATSMFLIILANNLPRLASLAAFWCLVVAHLEWPLISLQNPSTYLLPCLTRFRQAILRRYRRYQGRPCQGRRIKTSPSRLHDVQEQRMQPVVAAHLGVKRGGQHLALPDGDR